MIADTVSVSSAPATGQSMQMWLDHEMRVRGTGTATLLILSSPWPVSEDYLSIPLYSHVEVTDPQAGFRVMEPDLLLWSQNLSSLSAVAKVVIPSLRELTPTEQNGLRHYRKTLFRKV